MRARVPDIDFAIVGKAKITEYLLEPNHPDGGSKAAFFLSFGFLPEYWEIFRDALLEHAQTHDVVEIQDAAFGQRFIIDGPIVTPDGRTPDVRVVWMVRTGETIPRLVTAFPAKRASR